MVGQAFVKYNLEIASSQLTYIVTSSIDLVFTTVKKQLVICDKNVELMAHKILKEHDVWISVEANEQLKTLDVCAKILEEMAEASINRDFVIVAIGGGAVQDAVTLIASLYMRGIEWIYIPTTLMSMMDSCIGGKSSINIGRFKNTIGNFFPPKVIYINPAFTKSLSAIDISCGISEGAKICYAANMDSFESFVEHIKLWRESGSLEDLLSAIFASLEKKKWFIEIDEFDKKERKLLNFGHSFGHALEAASNFSIPHGIGILIGMMAAISHAGRNSSTESLVNLIKSEISFSGMADQKYIFSKEIFLDALARDKKNSAEFQNLILPNIAGTLEIQSFPLNINSLEKCFTSILAAMKELGLNYEIL